MVQFHIKLLWAAFCWYKTNVKTIKFQERMHVQTGKHSIHNSVYQVFILIFDVCCRCKQFFTHFRWFWKVITCKVYSNKRRQDLSNSLPTISWHIYDCLRTFNWNLINFTTSKFHLNEHSMEGANANFIFVLSLMKGWSACGRNKSAIFGTRMMNKWQKYSFSFDVRKFVYAEHTNHGSAIVSIGKNNRKYSFAVPYWRQFALFTPLEFSKKSSEYSFNQSQD